MLKMNNFRGVISDIPVDTETQCGSLETVPLHSRGIVHSHLCSFGRWMLCAHLHNLHDAWNECLVNQLAFQFVILILFRLLMLYVEDFDNHEAVHARRKP